MSENAPAVHPPAVDWPNLIRAVLQRECILVLGPGVATLERGGERVSLQTLLAQHLAGELRRRMPAAELVDDSDPAYVAKALEDAILAHEVLNNRPNFSRENARSALAGIIGAFYRQYAAADFPVYAQLAKMPFHFVVETCPAPFLARAWDDENKFGAQCLYYHYANPAHNNAIDVRSEEIQEYAPLVYQLFGSVEQPDSMVVTERDQLDFLDDILQKERTAGIPESVAIHFTSAEQGTFEKTFVFLGFDFSQWHLRLIMHLIGRYQRQKETYALQNPRDIGELTAFFYRNNFDVRFVDAPAEQFLADFDRALQQPVAGAAAPVSPRLKVFLMYDTADKADKKVLDEQLNPLKKTEFIQTWDESHILGGAVRDAEIAARLEEADIVLLLVTARFFGSGDIFDKHLRTALQRHETKQTVVVPLLMRSCLWNETPLGKLHTVLPRNRVALDKQGNPEVALSDTVEQLRGLCAKIIERKTSAR